MCSSSGAGGRSGFVVLPMYSSYGAGGVQSRTQRLGFAAPSGAIPRLHWFLARRSAPSGACTYRAMAGLLCSSEVPRAGHPMSGSLFYLTKRSGYSSSGAGGLFRSCGVTDVQLLRSRGLVQALWCYRCVSSYGAGGVQSRTQRLGFAATLRAVSRLHGLLLKRICPVRGCTVSIGHVSAARAVQLLRSSGSGIGAVSNLVV